MTTYITAQNDNIEPREREEVERYMRVILDRLTGKFFEKYGQLLDKAVSRSARMSLRYQAKRKGRPGWKRGHAGRALATFGREIERVLAT